MTGNGKGVLKRTEIFRSENIIKAIVIFTLACEVILLVYFNLFHIKDIVDSDFAMQMRHMTELAVNHTLIPKGWHFFTMGHFDDANLLSALFYTFSGNPYISFGLAGIVNMGIWSLVVICIFNKAGLEKIYALLTLSLIFATYNFGMLEYTNMMFFGGGFYVYVPLIPLMFVYLAVSKKEDIKNAGFIIISVLYIFLSTLTAASRGLYVFICGVFPVLLCIFVCLMAGVEKKRYPVWGLLTAVTLVTNIAGMMINAGMNVNVESYGTVKASMLGQSFITAFQDVFRLFRALEEGALSSPASMAGLARFVITLFILIFGLMSVNKLFGLRFYFPDNDKRSESREIAVKELIKTFLVTIFIVEFTIMVLTSSTPRYHLVGAIPLLVAAGMELKELNLKDSRKYIYFTITSLLAVMLLFNTVYSFVYTRNDYFHLEDGEYQRMDDILSIAEKYGANTVFADVSQAERLRNYDRSRVYETYDPENRTVRNREFYETEWDRSAFSDKNIIVTTQEEYEKYPDYIKNNYEKVGHVSIYDSFDQDVWFGEYNPIDGVSGLPVLSYSVDLPSGPDYKCDGEINEKGYLYTDSTGNVMISPGLYSKGDDRYNVTLHYDNKDAANANLDFYLNYELVSSTPLTPDKNEVSVEIPDMEGEYAFAVRKDDEKPLLIRETEFERLD